MRVRIRIVIDNEVSEIVPGVHEEISHHVKIETFKKVLFSFIFLLYKHTECIDANYIVIHNSHKIGRVLHN